MNKKKLLALSLFIFILIITILSMLYLMTESSTGRIIILILLVIITVLGAGDAIWHVISPERSLSQKLQRFSSSLTQEPIDVLKERYLELYNLYLKLSAKQKRIFYAEINRIREKIDEQLQAEKNIERLLEESSSGNISQQQKKYEEIKSSLQKLSLETRRKYQSQLAYLQERLESGK
ncbi:hypothetical protein J4228_04170 [Candidatus Woesearchaeota archaeon]|nr:hypothetical protein [Candidatus Woesearchaeota archaeon]